MRSKKFRVFAILLLVGLLLIAFVKHEAKARLNPQAIAAELSRRTGFAISARDISVTWTGGVAFTDFSIGEGGRTFLETREARVSMSLWDILKRNIVIQSLSLEKPSLKLDSTLLQTLSRQLKQKNENLQNFPVYLSNGSITYLPGSGKPMTVEAVSGNFRVSQGESPFTFHFRDQDGGEYQVSGTWNKQVANLQGKGRTISLSLFSLPGTADADFSLKGSLDKMKLDAALHVSSPLFQGDSEVNGDLFSTAQGSRLEGKIVSRDGKLKGIGTFSAMSVDFIGENGGASFKNGLLSLPNGVISFRGSMKKSGENQILIKADGASSRIQLNGRLFENISFHVKTQLIPHQALFDLLSLSVNGIPLSVNGKSRWDDQNDFWFDFSGLDMGMPAKLFPAPRSFEPMRMIVSGTIHYNAQKKNWDGDFSSSGGAIAGLPFDRFNGEFSRQGDQTVAFSGAFLVLGKKVLLSGEWGNGTGNLNIDADGIPLTKIPGAASRLAGFAGLADFHAKFKTGNRQSLATFSVYKVSYKGKPFPSLAGTVSVKGDTVQLSPITISGLSPPLVWNGKYNLKTKGADFEAKLNGQDPQPFLPFVFPRLAGIGGSLYGNVRVSGISPHYRIDFSGNVKNAHFQNLVIPAGNLVVGGTLPDQFSIRFDTNQFSLGELEVLHQFLPVDGTGMLAVRVNGKKEADISFDFPKATLKGQSLGDLKGSFSYHPPLLSVQSLSFPVGRSSIPVKGAVNLSGHSIDLHGELNGERVSDLARLLGKSSDSLDANLYGTAALKGKPGSIKFVFSGKGENLSVGGLSAGSAQLEARLIPTETGYETTVKTNLSVSSLSMVQKSYPGMTGDLQLNISKKSSEPPEIAFDLQHAMWQGKRFLSMGGKLIWKDPVADLSPVVVENLSPPLSMKGNYNSQTHSISLDGKLNGQTISALSALKGGSEPGVNGKMYGPLAITGSSSDPETQFNGTVTDLVYRGIHLGSGKLNLKSNHERVDGKLILDRSISIDPNSSLIGALIQNIPEIGNIYGSYAAHKAITGVSIEGNPAHPNVAPILETVQSRNAQKTPKQQSPEQQNPIDNILNRILNGGGNNP